MLVLQRMTKATPPAPPYTPANWSTGSDEDIAKTLRKYYDDEITIEELSEYWGIGDERKIHLDAMQAASPNGSTTLPEQDITVVIVAYDHNELASPINGHTKGCITVQTKECLHNLTAGFNTPGHIYVNGDSSKDMSFTKWSSLYMRTYLNDKVWGAFQSNFKSMIKPSKHYRHTTYNGSASEEVTDNLFLPSYPEIFGTVIDDYYARTNPAEGTQWEYFSNGDTTRLIKYGNNNGQPSNTSSRYWWIGSPASSYTSSSGYSWGVIDPFGDMNFDGGDMAYALAPAFVM